MPKNVTDRPMLNRLRHALEFAGLGSRIAPFPIRRQARPWTREDLPPLPPTPTTGEHAGRPWVPGPPDYIGIGTQKSGTSWWASLIERHPDVVPNRFGRKEMHYLMHFFDRTMTTEDVETYHAAFVRPDGRRCGEWTPNYMASPYTAVRLKQAAPKARVLVMVRNPITRFESGLNHEFRNRFGGMLVPSVRRAVIMQYALRKESIWMGMYAAQLATVLQSIPREQVLVLQYERCKADTAGLLAETYRFLGLDDTFVPDGLDRRVNEQKRVVDPLADEAREQLRTMYRDDVARLQAMFPKSIDLRLWTEFADLQPAGPADAARQPSEPSSSTSISSNRNDNDCDSGPSRIDDHGDDSQLSASDESGSRVAASVSFGTQP
ncbi:MAG: sulfotransferase family protein [Planctomycetota bacterium]